MSDLPREFWVETSPQPTRYTLAVDYYVVAGATDDHDRSNIAFYLEEDQLAVYRNRRGAISRETTGAAYGPVYRVDDQGPLAVPTGKVFLRFADHESIESHRAEIEQTGFTITETLPYAPQAGWVEASSGDIADAIGSFGALRKIIGVEAVEPQMLMESQPR